VGEFGHDLAVAVWRYSQQGILLSLNVLRKGDRKIGMKIRPHFGDTKQGLAIIGVGSSIGMATLGIMMFAFRELCEPILRLALGVFSRHGRRYDTEDYYLYAALPLILASIFVGMTVFDLATKSKKDRNIDRAIKKRWNHTARGAPLEPD
jgi:hypothetical protein